MSEKEINCQIGVVDKANNEDKGMADWCRAKVQWKVNDEKKVEFKETKDGKLKDFNNRGGADKPMSNDKYNFEDDGDKQGCMKDEAGTKYNHNGTMMAPSVAFYK
jgi:hypothetical protein